MDLLCFCSVLCLLCLCTRLFICALWSPAGKGLTSWFSFVVSNCAFVTFPLVSWVRCGTWLYRFLIFAPLLTLGICDHWGKPKHFQAIVWSLKPKKKAKNGCNFLNLINEGPIFHILTFLLMLLRVSSRFFLEPHCN